MTDKRIFSREVAEWLSNYSELLEAEATRLSVFADCSDSERGMIEAERIRKLATKISEVSIRLHDAKCVLLGGTSE